MPAATSLLEQLSGIVGATEVIVAPEELRRFSVDGKVPGAVARPGSADEVVEIVRLARSDRLALMPAGGFSDAQLGNIPRQLDVVVSLARMNQVLAYDPADLTVSVEAGATLAALEETLEAHQQFLPVDSPSSAATVGGILATHAGGPLRYGYGTVRDFTIGMQFVTGEGKIVKTGGRVVKNVAGYDLAKLMIGSLGTLGIITSANFRTFPVPPRTATLAAGFASLESALEMRRKIVHSVLQPRALDLLDREAARTLRGDTPEVEQTAWWLLVGVGGVEALVARHATEAEKLARESSASSFLELAAEPERQMWEGVRAFRERLAARYPAMIVVRASLPLTQLGAWLKKAQEVAARSGLLLAVVARAGTAVGYACLLAKEAGRATIGKMAQASTELTHSAMSLGGRAVIEFVAADVIEVKQQCHVWGPTRQDFLLMQKLKREFDPDGVLNPGRYVGGI